jgi:hypothetical protein
MGYPPRPRNKAGNNPLLPHAPVAEEKAMAEDREKISSGSNDRPLNEGVAGTGPGIPDEALAPGEELPEAPTDEQVERVTKKLGALVSEEDTLPLDGE